jgi:hypothetical protein
MGNLRLRIAATVVASTAVVLGGCAERITAPSPTVADYVLVAVADSTGRLYSLPVAGLIAPNDSEIVYAGTFSVLPNSRWRYTETTAVGFAGVWGPQVTDADSGVYRYSTARDSGGRTVWLLSFDPLNLNYVPARVVGDSVLWGGEVYVRIQ